MNLSYIALKVIPSLNSLYYLGVLKILHFEPHAQGLEHEMVLWLLIQKYQKAMGLEKAPEK